MLMVFVHHCFSFYSYLYYVCKISNKNDLEAVNVELNDTSHQNTKERMDHKRVLTMSN